MHPLARLSEERDEELVTVNNGVVVCVNVQELVYKKKKRILKSLDSILKFKGVYFGCFILIGCSIPVASTYN